MNRYAPAAALLVLLSTMPAVAAESAELPELVAELKSVWTMTTDGGRVQFQLDAAVTNVGRGNASAFTVRMALDNETLTEMRITNLSGGGRATLSMSPEVGPGWHEASFHVDVGGEVAELNESNNERRVRFYVEAPTDLGIVKMIVDTNEHYAGLHNEDGRTRAGIGAAYAATVTVCNHGPNAVGRTTDLVFTATSRTWWGAFDVARAVVPPLAVGACADVSSEFRVDAAGSFDLHASVIGVKDTNWTDNTRTMKVYAWANTGAGVVLPRAVWL